MNKKHTRQFMRNNPNILITKSDKGNKTVLIYKSDYIQKVEENLQNDKYYEKINRNPLSSLTEKIRTFVKKVNPASVTGQSRKERGKTNKLNIDFTDKNLARVYGLVKVHKENHPLRLIVSSRNTTLYELSKVLNSSISRGTMNPQSHIKDSWQLKEELSDIRIPPGYKLISLDVVALFTNVPLHLILRALEKRWENIQNHTPLTKSEFMEAIKLIFGNTFFSFNNKFYRQKHGAPMGLPLSPTVANLTLIDAEETCLEILRETFDISQIYLNYDSHNPIAQKKATVYNLVDRGIKLADPVFHAKNLIKIKDLLMKNNYPLKFIARHISIRTRKIKEKDSQEERANRIFRQQFYRRETKVVIPYIKNFSERIKRILSRHDIHTIFKSNNKFDEFIRLGKDKLNREDRTHVVYELNCLQCPKSYVGQTKRQLKKRVKEHRNNLTSSSQEPNVLSLHKIEHEGHDFDWNNPNILDTEPHYTKRTISEMFRIQLNNHGLNVRGDTKKLNSLYKNFFIDFEKLKKYK
ncbi:hypothetical protein QAD02_014047 [Eretmocerus hayati]|uniref:Uncharacterized protein n=1 Tax=Eretmocerus hayati TaxID=131215 RepID=A0ACC2P4F5_9HYME|nr:hypothetical protein QAD02_014047 [Eretmocerus hayati]